MCTKANKNLEKWHEYEIWTFAREMKSTKVQILGELRMRDTANWWQLMAL